MQKRTSIDIEIGSSVLFDSTDFFCKVKNLWYYLKQFCLPFITNFVPGDKT